MDKINVTFNDNLYTLNLGSEKILLNNNVLYFVNLNTPYNFERLTDLNILKRYKKFLIVVNEFQDNMSILKSLKKKFNLNFINFSLETFWSLYFNNGNLDENIYLTDNNFKIDLKTPNIIENYEKFEIKLTLLKSNFESYKKNLLNTSVDKLYEKYKNIEENINLLETYIKKQKKI